MGDEGMTFLDFIRKMHQEKRKRQRFVVKHYGPGPHPSGSPQSVHGKKGKKGLAIQVGITSYKSEKGQTPKQMKRDMAELKQDLGKTDIEDLSIDLGAGGWEGGSEPTFVTQFEGDGKARRILAEKAKKWDQEAVIIMQHVRKGGQPQTRISFGEALTEDEYRVVENGLLAASHRRKAGIGGWTWGQSADGHPVLIIQCIPKWGGNPKQHIPTSRDLLEKLRKIGYSVSLRTLRAEVEIWEREAGDYDRILGEKAG